MNFDRELVQIVDAAIAEAARRSGPWLACRLGCNECCMGPFAITPLDVRRLRQGLAELDIRDPERAGRVRVRAKESVARISREFPQDPVATVLTVDGAMDQEPCPALDPDTGGCDLYAARPIPCRTFGPALRFGSEPDNESLAVCELCYHGATDRQIANCAVDLDLRLEAELLEQLARGSSAHADTLVAFALAEAS